MTPEVAAAVVDMERQQLPDWKLSYRPDEAAAATGLGQSTIFLRIRQKRLKAKKDGNVTLIPRDELQRYLNALPDKEAKAKKPRARG